MLKIFEPIYFPAANTPPPATAPPETPPPETPPPDTPPPPGTPLPPDTPLPPQPPTESPEGLEQLPAVRGEPISFKVSVRYNFFFRFIWKIHYFIEVWISTISILVYPSDWINLMS